jgi:hypothetical protein
VRDFPDGRSGSVASTQQKGSVYSFLRYPTALYALRADIDVSRLGAKTGFL